MGRIRNKIRTALEHRDLGTLVRMQEKGDGIPRHLMSCLYDADTLIQWRAIEAFGVVLAQAGKTDLERVRRTLRDLLWSMNDESGSIIWNAPETMGEILFRIPELIEEYYELLLSRLHVEPFSKGVIWAVGRIGLVKPHVFTDTIAELAQFLNHTDPVVRGYAALTLGIVVPKTVIQGLYALQTDNTNIPVYDFETGDLRSLPIVKIARNAIRIIEQSSAR